MVNHLNLPTAEQQAETNRLLGAIAFPDRVPEDHSGSPGNNYLTAGDKKNGFYGFVRPEEFGLIQGNPEGSKHFNGTNLAMAIGLTAGASINEKTTWIKATKNGRVLFIPVKPLRRSVSWNHIYNAGAVYGDDTVGTLPPLGRAGKQLSAEAATNSFTITPGAEGEGFLYSSERVGNVGDTIVVKGFANEENNGEFTITAITDTAITVSGGQLVSEAGLAKTVLYNKTSAVSQDRKVTIGDKEYRVRLMKGASQDPLDSFLDTDRDSIGDANEWNSLILPLHERAKLGDWNYTAYAGDVEDWGAGLTDADLITHHTHGYGSYSWMQETSDNSSFRRVIRGNVGASYFYHLRSWGSSTPFGWRPCLELL